MSTAPPKQTATSASKDSGTRPLAPKASRQRFKPQLSCAFCRTGKLRCDRNLPCQNCIKRDLSASCTYNHVNVRRDKATPTHKSSATGNPKDLQSQISHLEELVITLMNKTNRNGNGNASLEDSTRILQEESRSLEDQRTEEVHDIKEAEKSFGRINIEDDQPNYVGSTHWVAILDNIACLKDQFGNFEPPVEEETHPKSPEPISKGPDLLVGGLAKATRNEILASMPSRPFADHLVQEYFGSADMGATMFHAPTFMKEYENFWANPHNTPIMWIGLLFGILSLTAYFEMMTESSSFGDFRDMALRDPVEAINVFREKTVQCLILGNYTEPGPYTVETLLLYYIVEHFRSPDTQFGAWLVFGLIIRAAMRLGFHRDASHYPEISVFRGEMQRRLWASIIHLDLHNSLQVGLPRMIKDGMYDTAAPRNLSDDDFHESVKVLPPNKPDGALAPISYSNIKHKMTLVFGEIVDPANSTYPISYDAVMELDKLLHKTHEETPDVLKIRSIEDLAFGTPENRVVKFSIDLTFQKARCVLHRKFFILSKGTATYPYPYSTKTCIEASMRILECQIYMDRETGPDRVLHKQRWKASSLVTHDFLLAAMLVCLYLGQSIGLSHEDQNNGSGIRLKWTRENMLQTLNSSHQIFEALSGTSREALKATKALNSMLTKVRAASGQDATVESSRPVPNSVYVTSTPGFRAAGQTSQNYQMPESSMPWSSTHSYTSQDRPVDMSTTNYSPDINEHAPATVELNWELWDNHFYNSSAMDQTLPDLWNFDWQDLSYMGPPPLDPANASMQWDQ
ncbi:Fusarisetin A cluster transcription factor fsa6 [Lachnellula arida]|uniref:Fusarisetin A cluster transcription factor fsa6 n=1 Tax=Lachnellula arida TaxID=1316785 RepID=A0A8T9B8B3_9HELO|nr:Fusarisetin A cluster transcription factor fsa6 [Lachnellula arida]